MVSALVLTVHDQMWLSNPHLFVKVLGQQRQNVDRLHQFQWVDFDHGLHAVSRIYEEKKIIFYNAVRTNLGNEVKLCTTRSKLVTQVRVNLMESERNSVASGEQSFVEVL